MRSRYFVLGVCGVLFSAAGGFAFDWCCFVPVPVPAPLDVGSLKAARKMSKSAVGGGKAAEGYVATFGTFRLGAGEYEGSSIFPGPRPGAAFFREFDLVYINEYTDPGTGMPGSLYYTSVNADTQRFYLFGQTNVACEAPVEQRQIITFDGNGNVLHQSVASYAKMPIKAERGREKEKEKEKKRKKKKEDD